MGPGALLIFQTVFFLQFDSEKKCPVKRTNYEEFMRLKRVLMGYSTNYSKMYKKNSSTNDYYAEY